MRVGYLLTFTLAVLSPLMGNTILDNNPTGTGGGYPGTVCGDQSCDVIGQTGPSSFAGWTIGGARYDIESVAASLQGSNVIFTLRFNYDNGDATLAPFLNSAGTATLNPGDLLFSAGGSFLWGIPLTGHNGLTAGHLYGNNGSPVGTQTAQQVLNDTSTNYRFTWPVWLGTTPPLSDAGGFVSINTTNVALGTSPEVQTVITLNTAGLNGAFLTAFNGGQLSASFASATCGNDVLTGPINGGQSDIPNAPEPVSSSLFGGGLLALAVLGRKELKKRLGK